METAVLEALFRTIRETRTPPLRHEFALSLHSSLRGEGRDALTRLCSVPQQRIRQTTGGRLYPHWTSLGVLSSDFTAPERRLLAPVLAALQQHYADRFTQPLLISALGLPDEPTALPAPLALLMLDSSYVSVGLRNGRWDPDSSLTVTEPILDLDPGRWPELYEVRRTPPPASPNLVLEAVNSTSAPRIGSPSMKTPFVQLSDLLQDMFDAAELRAFLRRLSGGKSLADALPDGRGIALLAGDAVDVLNRRGRVDDALFAALLAHAVDRRADIAAVADAWGMSLPVPPDDSDTKGDATPLEVSVVSHTEVAPGGAVDVVVLIALEEEYLQFSSFAPDVSPLRDDEYGGYDFIFSAGPEASRYRCVARFVGKMGPELAGLFTDRLIARWHPEVVVMLGIAGALHDDLHLGDVVVAEQVSAYLAETKAVPTTTHKRVPGAKAMAQAEEARGYSFQPRPRVFHCDHSLLQEVANLRFAHAAVYEAWSTSCGEDLKHQVTEQIRQKLGNKGLLEALPRIHRIHLASGPAVVTAVEFGNWLRSQDATIKAAEMEAAGLVESAATRRNPPRTFVIRGISDLGDERKRELDNIGNGGFRRLAMRNATRMLFAMLNAGLLPRSRGDRGLP